MAAVSIGKPLELRTSRSGRLLIPRLRNWTGERILVKKSGSVQVFEGSPDCTSTFVPDRKLFNTYASPRLSLSLNTSRATLKSPNKVAKQRINESLPSTLFRQENLSKQGKRVNHSIISLKKNETAPNVKRTSPRKGQNVSPAKPMIKVSSSRSPVEKLERQRKSRSLTRKSSSSRSPARNRKRAVSIPSISSIVKAPFDRSSPVKKRDIPFPKSPRKKQVSTRSSPRKKSESSPAKPLNANASEVAIPTRSSPRIKSGVPSVTSPKENIYKAIVTRSSPRKNTATSSGPKVNEHVSPAKRSSPRKKTDEPPSKISRGKSQETSLKSPTDGQEKSKRLKKKPKKSNKAEQEGKARNDSECDFNVSNSRFQPVVRLIRLLPEEILAVTALTVSPEDKSPSKHRQISPRRVSPRKRKSPLGRTTKSAAKKQLEESPVKRRPTKESPSKDQSLKSPFKLRVKLTPCRRTVRDTQQILEALKKPINSNEVEDEAASTGAFFKNSRANALKDLQEVDDILNNDFGESDDNLSFRSIYERESSPMPAVPVSPISSFHETDAENSGLEDGLLGESPIVARPTSFQKAKLLHRTLKNRETVTKKMNRARQAAGESPPGAVFAPIIKAATNSVPCHLLQPKAMRALEKNLKKKTIRGEKFKYEALYNGNTLQISLNSSDSDTSTESFDSDNE